MASRGSWWSADASLKPSSDHLLFDLGFCLWLNKSICFFEQKKIMDGIETLCSHLPGTPAKLCKDEVEKMFPMAIAFLTTIVVSFGS